MAVLRLLCFGNLELFDSGTPLSKPTTLKSQSLLTYLVLHRDRPSTRERLMAMFWGDRPARRARRSLSTALWHVRRCLPDEHLIVADNQTVQFHGDVWVDAEAFAIQAAAGDLPHLEKAASLYRGDFLDSFYDEWVINERYQLQSVYQELLTRLVALYEEDRRHQQVLLTALRLLELDPLQETAHRAAMRAYASLGRRNAALEQYQRCQDVVAQELGIAPMPETVDLAAQIRAGRFPSEPISKLLEPIAFPPPPARHTDFATPFVGRVNELAKLNRWWRAGRGGLLLIAGEAGMGKTRLVQEFGRHLPGAPALYGHCYEFERVLPYQPFAEALRPLAISMPVHDWMQLPGWVVTEIIRLLPELEQKLLPQRPVELQADRTRFFSAVGHLLAALAAKRSLPIIVEDLHWATESTLQLLHYLARQLSQQPVFFVGTYRQDEIGPDHPLLALQRQLDHGNLAQAFYLPSLSAEEVEELVMEMTGEVSQVPSLAQRLYQETEGNPFFLVETIRALYDANQASLDQSWSPDTELPLPATISAAIMGRVQRLPAKAQEALRLAAVLGREFDYELLQAVWQKEDEEVLEALEVWLRHLLVAEGTGASGRDYSFTHHKVQEVLYDSISQRRRQHTHARVAAAMERLYDPPKVASELAFHCQQGQQFDRSLAGKASTYLRLAGEQAVAQFAHEEAVSYFNQALDLMVEGVDDRYSLLLAREKVFDQQGNRAAQVQDLETLAQLVQAMPAANPETAARQATVALRRTNYSVVTGEYAAAVKAAQEAATLATSEGMQAEAHLQWGLALHHQGDYDAAVTQLQQALLLTRSAALPVIEARCLIVLGLVYWRQSRYDDAKTCLATALDICRRPEVNDLNGEGNALGNLGVICRYQGDYAQAKDYFEQALAIWIATGYRRGEGLYLVNLGVVAMDTADFLAAREYYERALAICVEVADRDNEQTVLNNLAVVSLLQGDFEEAMALAQHALQICRDIGNRHGEGITYTYLGEAAKGLGDFAGAEAYFGQALRIRRERSDQRGVALALMGLGELAAEKGKYDTAASHLDQALDVCRQIGNSAEECRALYGLAQVAMGNGNLAVAATNLERALQISRDIQQPALEAQILTGLAGWAHANGADVHAQEYGQQALSIAQRIGARATEGDAWHACGLALEALGRREEAAVAYQQALAIRQAIHQDFRLTEPQAGLKRISDHFA